MGTLKINTLDDLHSKAKEFIDIIGSPCVVVFYAPMGAGKTTFIKAICEELGANDQVSSPTFALVNEYETRDGQLLYHFDCYRLKNLAEAFDIGAEEYFYSGNFCFVEWPEKIEQLLPDNTVKVSITVGNDGSRTVSIDKP